MGGSVGGGVDCSLGIEVVSHVIEILFILNIIDSHLLLVCVRVDRAYIAQQNKVSRLLGLSINKFPILAHSSFEVIATVIRTSPLCYCPSTWTYNTVQTAAAAIVLEPHRRLPQRGGCGNNNNKGVGGDFPRRTTILYFIALSFIGIPRE